MSRAGRWRSLASWAIFAPVGRAHERGSASGRLEHRLAAARAPQVDVEARHLKASAKAALFGGKRRTKVARYELGEVLGRGGAGVVYRAHDPELARSIALKIVRA